MERDIEENLSTSIDCLIAGAPLHELLMEYPQHAQALREAQMLLRSGPASEPSLVAREAAKSRMLNGLAVAPSLAVAPPAVAAERGAWLSSFMRRPAAFRAAAVAGSLALVGALGIGAAAATGNAPEPVRELFGSSASSAIRVEFEGAILAVDPAASTLDVEAGGDVRVVHVVDTTELSRGGGAIAFGDLAAGNAVEVKGTLQFDHTIVATRIDLEDEAADGEADGVAGAEPTADDGDLDDDEDGDDPTDDGDLDDDGAEDEDNSGTGDDDIEDSSGPGDGDEDQEDSSGTGESDDEIEDSSEPGDGEDHEEEDSEPDDD